MKRFANVLAVVMIVGMAMTVVAGEGGKCTASTQDCLDYMASNMKERGWVGLELEDKGDDGRMIVAKVVANSPASSAALVAVNGVAFSDANEKKLKEIKYSMKPGAEFTYTVARRGSRIDLAVELAQIPQDVMAQWVGNHMLDHAETQMASAE
jgi:predicted metalloprotease with PDZ domain